MTIQYATAEQATGATRRLLRNADVPQILGTYSMPAEGGFLSWATIGTQEGAETAAAALRISGYERVMIGTNGVAHIVAAFSQINSGMDPDACPNPWHLTATGRMYAHCPECQDI